MQRTLELTFAKPITLDAASVASITLREPVVRDVLAAEKAAVSESGEHARRVRNTALIAAVTGLSLDLVRKMPATAFRTASAFLNGFSKLPADYQHSGDPEMILELDPRIEKSGRIVTQLDLREPTTGELEEAQRKLGRTTTDASMREAQIHLIALVSELPRFIIELLPVSKADEASRYLAGFM